MPHHLKKRNWYLFVASVLIVTTLAVPLAKVILPPIYRSLQLNKLASSDPQVRAQGQTYLLLHAASKPEVVDGAIERLADVEDDRAFLELVITLDQLGYWTRQRIELTHWLRWLAMVGKDSDPQERIRVMQLVANLPEHSGDPRVQTLFRSFISDPDAEVRYNAMVCAAEMRGASLQLKDKLAADVYAKLIDNMTGDLTPLVARHAWLFLGLMQIAQPLELTPQHLMQPDVAEAMMWVASTQSNGKAPPAVIEALNDPKVTPRIRAMAAYTLGLASDEASRDAMIALLDQGPRAVTDENQVAFWRTILSIRLLPDVKDAAQTRAANDPAYAALLRFLGKCIRADYDNAALRPLILACIFRDRRLLVDAALVASDIVTIADDPVAWLASIEGVPQALEQQRGQRMTLTPPDGIHDQIRLAMLRAMDKPTGADFLPLCISDKATVRDLACVLATKRLSKEEVAWLVRRLMKPLDLKGDPLVPVYRYEDAAKQSAAILAGLAGVELPLLEQMATDFSDRPGIIEIIQLGLWMQDKTVPGAGDMNARVDQLLMRTDMPTSTILLALMHRKDPIAFERLLSPRGDQNPALLKLLDEDRWWFVLDHFLPADAPRLWVWADNDLARFQLDLLRDWYVVNRYRFRKIAVK